jgi:glycine oxidase
MIGMAKYPDVAVIGGGIIGLTSAYVLAKAGLVVELIDRGEFGREASWAGAGIVPPGLNPLLTTTPLDHLRSHSSAGFRTFSQDLKSETGIDNQFHLCGGVEFLGPDDEDFEKLWEQEKLPYEFLSPEKLDEVIPGVRSVPETSAYYHPLTGQVRNPRHLAALVEACRLRGVRLTTGLAFVRWEKLPRGVVAVTSDHARHPAGRYLVASGAWADEVLGQLGYRSRVHPVRGQIVLFRPERPVLRKIVQVGHRYLVPRLDGRILVGSTEEPEAGFDRSTTPEGVRELIAFAHELVPDLREVEVERTWAGLRPGSPDGLPFIGPVPGQATVLAAVGHFRAGIQLSIGTAELIRDLILGYTPTLPADAFRLDRPPAVTARPAFRS